MKQKLLTDIELDVHELKYLMDSFTKEPTPTLSELLKRSITRMQGRLEELQQEVDAVQVISPSAVEETAEEEDEVAGSEEDSPVIIQSLESVVVKEDEEGEAIVAEEKPVVIAAAAETAEAAAAAAEEEEEEEEEIVVGNPEKDEEPVIVPEAPEMPESEQLELPEVTVEPAQSAEVSMKIETNTASTPILAERIKTAGDLRRSISLNDSFRFSRELFGGSMEQMNHVLQQIGEMHSLDAALVFLSSKIKVEEENEAKADLVELLKKYFI